MRLRYGLNETDNWWYFALGPHRARIQAGFRALHTRVVRIFLFDKHAPDPVTEWPLFAAYVQAVLDIGAVPMITFARFGPPFDSSTDRRRFAARCADVAWGSVEQWGGHRVRDWYWCIWNEPNSELIGGGLDFDQYRLIYEEVAGGVLRWLSPYLSHRPPRIGGPAVDGFQPFWLDWMLRFLREIDGALVGFASWHRYGDWREQGEAGAPLDDSVFSDLLMAQTPEYEARSRAVGRLAAGRDVLNVCGELNVHSHYDARVSRRFNQTVFGAAYYASALIHLMRGGADLEMLWTGTDDAGPYGLLDKTGRPTPVFHAKRLCAEHVRFGDWLVFPPPTPGSEARLDVVVARGQDGRCSGVLVHLRDEVASYPLDQWGGAVPLAGRLYKVDRSTGGGVLEDETNGSVTFHGYGVAVVTTRDSARRMPCTEATAEDHDRDRSGDR